VGFKFVICLLFLGALYLVFSSKLKEEDHHKIYGKNELYNTDRGKPLTNKEMHESLTKLKADIVRHTK
jgi:hypothetical protein